MVFDLIIVWISFTLGEAMSLSRQQAERLRKQRERQKIYRAQLKAERKPTRDDIARVVLHFMIVRAANDKDRGFLDQFIDLILADLKTQGFDEATSLDVLDDLIIKYTKMNWDFRRKIHLLIDADISKIDI